MAFHNLNNFGERGTKMKKKIIGFSLIGLSALLAVAGAQILMTLYETWRIPRHIINRGDELFLGATLLLAGIGIMLITSMVLCKHRNETARP